MLQRAGAHGGRAPAHRDDGLQAFVTEPYTPVLSGLVSSMDLYIYAPQTARGELVAGAEMLPYTTYSTRSTYEFLAEAAKRTIQMLPFMAKARAMRQWGGLCDMTPDSSPLLGESEVRNFFLMSGMGTWGFKGAPIFGSTMAEMLATGRVDPLIAPFAPDRFRQRPHGARRRERRHPPVVRRAEGQGMGIRPASVAE